MELEGHATETQKQISEELDKLLLADNVDFLSHI